MLATADRLIVQTFMLHLSRVLTTYELRVFGSRARGDAVAESDLDLFIEVESINPELRQTISEIAWEVGLDADRVISTFVVTSEQLEHGAVGANPLINHVMTEGVAM
jgi:predicted nucleotidyltransferase